MRTATICAALTALLATGSVRAQAVEPTTLQLRCDGTMERGKGDIPIHTGIIVDFTARKVFTMFYGELGQGAPPEITGLNDVKIYFSGTRRYGNDWGMTIDGEIDRVTGDAKVVEKSGKSRENPILTETYSLKCSPTNYGFRIEFR